MQQSASIRNLPDRASEENARLLQAMAHPVRLKIIERLMRGPCPATSIARATKQSPSMTSQHLATLLEHNLVVRRRAGRERIYTLHSPVAIRIVNVLRQAQHDQNLQDGLAI